MGNIAMSDLTMRNTKKNKKKFIHLQHTTYSPESGLQIASVSKSLYRASPDTQLQARKSKRFMCVIK